MAYRIEYLKGGEITMIVPCPMPLHEAREAALKGLTRYAADTARILDMDAKGKEVARVTQ